MQAGPNDYGFYSNVSPDVDHARWSQAKDRRIGEIFSCPLLVAGDKSPHQPDHFCIMAGTVTLYPFALLAEESS